MRLIDKDALMKELEKEVELADDWKTAHEIANVVKYFPTVQAPEWISVKDRMPKSGKHVLANCEIERVYGSKRSYVCIAFYAQKGTISLGNYWYDDTEAYEYDEEKDEYYLMEGWYEAIHNWGEYSSVVIDDFVTHWMPLPEPAKEDDAECTNTP